MPSEPRSGPEDCLEAAAHWLVREAEPDFSAEDARALADWRAQDLRHDRAYLDLQSLWSTLPELRHLAERYPLADTAEPAGPVAANDDDSDRPARRGALRFLWAGGVAAAAAAVAFVALPALFQAPAPAIYATDVGQISEIVLEDGSVATLAPKSGIAVTFSDDLRHIDLTSGEAFFKVTGNRERPFVVRTGASAVRVVGTQFNVRRGPDTVQVAVLQGSVQIRESAADAPDRPLDTLNRGDRADVTVGTRGRVAVSKLGRSDGGAQFGDIVAGWRKGWLVYDDARLGDIVADMNRYYRPGVTVSDPHLEGLRVTASFKAAEIPQFVSSLDRLFPVTVDQQADGAYRVKAN